MKRSKKKPNLKALKDKAWKAFSRYIRLRDSLATTGTLTRCKCVTCGAVKPTFGEGSIQAGHFIGGRHGKNLFEPRAVYGQCQRCNAFLHGNNGPYTEFMMAKYGHIDEDGKPITNPGIPSQLDWIVRQANTPYTYTAQEYEEIARMYDLLSEGF